jgi:hypothetical protein
MGKTRNSYKIFTKKIVANRPLGNGEVDGKFNKLGWDCIQCRVFELAVLDLEALLPQC